MGDWVIECVVCGGECPDLLLFLEDYSTSRGPVCGDACLAKHELREGCKKAARKMKRRKQAA